jgi:hypothetical protein
VGRLMFWVLRVAEKKWSTLRPSDVLADRAVMCDVCVWGRR